MSVSVSQWTEDDSRKAHVIWTEYQRNHDVSERMSETAGIEPLSGRIWFGKSIQDVIARRDADGCDGPLFFVRVGFDSYYRKGGRR